MPTAPLHTPRPAHFKNTNWLPLENGWADSNPPRGGKAATSACIALYKYLDLHSSLLGI